MKNMEKMGRNNFRILIDNINQIYYKNSGNELMLIIVARWGKRDAVKWRLETARLVWQLKSGAKYRRKCC